MDLIKNGKLLCSLRKEKGLTQKQVADILGVVPKTVSKWETGRGFPDVSALSGLADILGVSERTLLSGDAGAAKEDMGNMKRMRYYVCPTCNSFMQGTGNGQVICCGKPLEALTAAAEDDGHELRISEIEDEYYIEIDHDMKKDHYISFISYVRFDRVLTVRLYPEQACAVRFPKMYGGRFYYYCTKHGLFEHR